MKKPVTGIVLVVGIVILCILCQTIYVVLIAVWGGRVRSSHKVDHTKRVLLLQLPRGGYNFNYSNELDVITEINYLDRESIVTYKDSRVFLSIRETSLVKVTFYTVEETNEPGYLTISYNGAL